MSQQSLTPPTTGQLRPPGMHDVARLAGVSHQTVSRVLNAHPNVRDETRDRVQAAITALGYRRNIAARALVTRRSMTIGVVTSGSTLWGPSSALIGVEIAARAAGYYVSVATLDGVETGEVARAFEHFVDQSVDGIVVIAPEAALAHAADPFVARVPVVVVAAGAEPSPGVQITGVDQLAGARLAVRHLIDLGHRQIAHVTGPAGWFDAAARTVGWQSELRRARLRRGAQYAGDWTAHSGYRAASRMLDDAHGGRRGGDGDLPTAVFAANDLMALGVVRALHDAGVTVPHQISVIGFDDIPGAAHFIPGLTTVRQDFQALGRQCIEILLTALDGGTAGQETALVPPSLVVRESSAPPSAG